MSIVKLRHSAFIAAIYILIALVTLTAATYAWFSFVPYTNVTPMTGAVGGGDGSLLISNRPDGVFDVTCDLILSSNTQTLQPLSTADLQSFYTATAQTPAGVSVKFASADSIVDTSTIHGTVYLKSEGASHDVYLDRPGIFFGGDAQALASLRLGLRITSVNGTYTHIFALDDAGNTSGAGQRLTVETSGTVVSSIGSSGDAVLVQDPAVQLGRYWAERTEDQITPGQEALCRLALDETASVEYWLYLEGCDINCINDVQSRDLALQLAFSGVSAVS